MLVCDLWLMAGCRKDRRPQDNLIDGAPPHREAPVQGRGWGSETVSCPRQSWMPNPALGGDPGRVNSNLFTHGKGERW